jgi:hypothetical protein
MIASETDLPWVERDPEPVRLGSAELLYEDELPLSDIAIAPSGAFCCLRRVPGFAEVIVWPGRPSGRPASWTGTPNLPLLETFGFDGNEMYGRTASALLRIRPEEVETLVAAKGGIRAAGLSPDRSRIFWIDHTDEGRLHLTSTTEPALPKTLETRDPCLEALWLPDGTLLARQVHTTRGGETRTSILLCTPDGQPVRPVIETRKWLISSVHPSKEPGRFFAFGTRHDFSERVFRWRPRPPGQVGAWSMRLSDGGLAVECIANAAPAGGTVESFDGTCLFADAWQQTAERSVLVAASSRGVRTAVVPAFLRNFAAADEMLFYPSRAGRFGISALPLGPLIG